MVAVVSRARAGLFGWLLVASGAWPSACSMPRTMRDAQLDYADRMKPPPLASQPDDDAADAFRGASGSEPAVGRPLDLRIYLDRHVLSSFSERDAEDMVEYLNGVLAPRFARSFAVKAIVPWELGSSGTSLEEALEELEVLDQGDDVDWVLGIVTSLPVVSEAVDHVAISRRLGRHMVVRHAESAAAMENIQQGLDRLSQEEQLRLYALRKRHEQATRFLFAWGYSLGAVVTHEPGYFMNLAYETDESRFDNENATLIEIGLRHRDLERSSPSGSRSDVRNAWKNALEQRLSSTSWFGWDRKDREHILAWLRGDVEAPRSSAGTRRRLNEADRQLRSGDTEGAWVTLEALVADARNDRDRDLYALACRVARLREPKGEGTITLCRKAADLSEGAEQELELAAVYIDRGEPELAEPILSASEARQMKAKASSPRTWAYLANLFSRTWRLTSAERAAQRAGDEGRAVVAWVEAKRAALTLPRNAETFGVSDAQEGAYLRVLRSALTKLNEKDRAGAEVLAREVARIAPLAPPTQVLLCELALDRNQLDEAERSCTEANRSAPLASRPRLLLAIILGARGRIDDSIRALRGVIETARDFEPAWRQLAHVFEFAKKTQDLEQLAAEYQRQFNKPMEK